MGENLKHIGKQYKRPKIRAHILYNYIKYKKLTYLRITKYFMYSYF